MDGGQGMGAEEDMGLTIWKERESEIEREGEGVCACVRASI